MSVRSHFALHPNPQARRKRACIFWVYCDPGDIAMTVIQSASRYAYTPAYRARQSTGEDVTGFSPNATDEIDPDGGRAGNPVKPPVTRQVQEAADSRFEFSLSYRSAFFHASSKDGTTARDDRTRTTDVDNADAPANPPQSNETAAAAAPGDAEMTSDDLPENPIDLLASLLGGT
jgi:hypothetical protein